MGEALDKEAYLRRLNEKLSEQPGFEEGMAFLDLDGKGYQLCDPRLLQLQRGERVYNFLDASFAAAIEGTKKQVSRNIR